MSATLRTGTALYASALLIDRLLGLLLLPLLTRAIAPADYGAWTQTAVAAGILMPVVLLATPTAIVRSFSSTHAAALKLRFFARLGGVAVAVFAMTAAAALVWRDALSVAVWGDAGRASLVPALLALLAADAAVDFAMAWLRAAGRMALVSSALTLRSVLRYGVVVALVGGGDDGRVAALVDWIGRYAAVQCALAAVLVAATAAVLWRARAEDRAGAAADAAGAGIGSDSAGGDARDPAVAPLPHLRGLLAFSVPLVGLAVFTAVNAGFDRFLLARLLGLDAVAVYAAAVSLSSVPALFYTVLGFTLFPVLARHWAAGRRDEAARLTSLALATFAFLCVPSALALAIAGPSLLPLLSTTAYRAEPAVFALLGVAVAAFGLYQILLYTLLLDGRSRQVLVLAMTAAAANAALNLLLAPGHGAVGAAAAAAVSNAAMVGVAATIARRVMPWRFPWAPIAAIGWRAGAATLPLAAVVLGPRGSAVPWSLAAAALALGAAAYVALDWRSPASVARMLWPR